MRRWLALALTLFGILAVPPVLILAGVFVRPETGMARIGNGLYIAAALLAVALPLCRWLCLKSKKTLPGVCTRQGLLVCLIGISGLLLLAGFAPRFPESARVAYLTGIGVIILFTLIPLGLLDYLRRKFPPSRDDQS